MNKIFTLIISLFISIGFYGQDTFSICAIDTVTGEVGSAGASCVYIAGQGVRILSDVHPGIGVIHTQAYYLAQNQSYARTLMNEGLSPQQIIDSLVANDYQNNPTRRQYGIVDFRDGVVRTAGYTGNLCDDYKNHIIGPNYTIQGNILLGQQILDSMEARFLRSEGELACRLMEALQGANVPGADTRCLGDGTSSIGSFLRVAKPDDPVNDLYIDINIPITENGVDPIDSMQVVIDQWGGCNITRVGERLSEEMVSVYPNPSSDFFIFQLNESPGGEKATLMIYDSQGAETANLPISGNDKLKWNVEGKIPGIYFYRLMRGEQRLGSGKLIVE